jgi:putative nucleotidyltransferase with HDIG domain
MTESDVPRALQGCSPPHRQRLLAAFEALEHFPALVAARDRVLALFGVHDDEDDPAPLSASKLTDAIASDVALTVRVIGRANALAGRSAEHVTSVGRAVEVLDPLALRRVVEATPTFDFFERAGPWDVTPEHFRLHALACQRVAGTLAKTATDWIDRDELMTAALLHDVGKLALLHAFPRFPVDVYGPARTPEERLVREQQALHTDHAQIGSALAQHWGLPERMQAIIAGHHAPDAGGEAAFVRLADMLAHRAQGAWVSPTTMLRVGKNVGLGLGDMRVVLYDLPGIENGRQRQVDASPLSEREIEVLRGLDEGKVYKQIASELEVSTSTVRTHLHNIYRKLGAHDRAQAVLIAREHGWI